MASSHRHNQQSALFTFIAIILVVAVLWMAQVVLIPLALAVLLSFLLAPVCVRLERWGLGRVLSVLTVTVLSFLVIFIIGWVVAGQMIDLAGKLPLYQDNIRAKLQSLEMPSAGPLGRATRGIRELTRQIREVQEENAELNPLAPEPENQAAAPEPVPVRIIPEPMRPTQTIAAAAGPLLRPLASAGIVIVFVIFMLLQRDDLRDRIMRLIGQTRLTVATQAIDDAASRVSRYLLAQFIVNATYGIAAGVGLYLIGVPQAVLWGVLATLLRFIPYVGPWLGALLPIALSAAVFDRWTPVLMTAGLFVVIELISNNIMEPLLYGSRTGVSPVAILASAVFWAWLWGPVGLVLATPLTVCVVVLGRYIPRLEFLSVLLSDQPGLTPAARLYQRLLAMDQDDVFDLADEYLKDHAPLDLYEQVLLPALALAERDRHHGRLDAEREQAVYDTLRDLIEDLSRRPAEQDASTARASDHQREGAPAVASGKDADSSSDVASGPETQRRTADADASDAVAVAGAVDADAADADGDGDVRAAAKADDRGPGLQHDTLNAHSHAYVICIPARDVGDEIAGLMLAHLLRLEAVRVETVPRGLLISEMLDFVAERKPDALCISALPPQALVRTRHLCQRILERLPDFKLVVGLWQVTDVAMLRRRIDMCSPDNIATTLAEAVHALDSVKRVAADMPAASP